MIAIFYIKSIIAVKISLTRYILSDKQQNLAKQNYGIDKSGHSNVEYETKKNVPQYRYIL